MKKLFGFVLAVSFVTLGVACGSDYSCKDACEAGNKCEGAEQMDCAKYCDATEDVADKADCNNKLDDYLSCVEDNEKAICDEDSTACQDESAAMFACMLGYCMTHMDQCAAFEK